MRKTKETIERQTNFLMKHIERCNNINDYASIKEMQDLLSDEETENIGDLEIRSLIQKTKKRFLHEQNTLLANERKRGYKFAETEDEIRMELRKSLKRMVGDFTSARVCLSKLKENGMNTDIEASKDEEIILDILSKDIPAKINTYKDIDRIKNQTDIDID